MQEEVDPMVNGSMGPLLANGRIAKKNLCSYGRSLRRKLCSSRSKICVSILLTLLILLIIALVATFIILPLFFMASVELQRLLMFTNIFMDKDPNDFKTQYSGLRNFYLKIPDEETGENITLGVWHLVPNKYWALASINFDELLMDSGFPVVMHFHGSGETRKDSLGMYSVLYHDFHVIAIEYRDFGDSSPAKLSEEAVSRDSQFIYRWVRKRTKQDIYFWGHSLGTALGTLTTSDLKEEGIVPTGLILEAPMTSMREEIPVHPYGRFFAWLPWFEATIQLPLERSNFTFNNSLNILNVDCPIMILHAEDDSIIPYQLGRKLSEIATFQRTQSQGPVFYHQYPKDREYDHFRIFLAPELPDQIKHFRHVCERFKKHRQDVKKRSTDAQQKKTE